MSDLTAAHKQIETFHIAYEYPSHEPRASDPHYRAFNAAHDRLKRLGALKCWIGNADCQGAIELHHNVVEFALANTVDVAHFEQLYPEFKIASDEEFLTWIEGEGNLLPLCAFHHRGVCGIHSIHYPAWQVQRFMKAGVGPPEAVVREGVAVHAGETVTVSGSAIITPTPGEGAATP
jgi:hypothetical protein